MLIGLAGVQAFIPETQPVEENRLATAAVHTQAWFETFTQHLQEGVYLL